MSSARVRALILSLGAAAALAVLAVAGVRRQQAQFPPRRVERRPMLLLVTSLPLLFSDRFSLEAEGAPAIRRLRTRYRVVPISVTDPRELAKGRLLLMAQPQAQTAENLVALDTWVRGGGRLLLMADPLLEWPSSQPLGDLTRPPAVFMDTGLLEHWGLQLDPPENSGTAQRELGGFLITTVSPGSISGSCKISRDRFVAHCLLGAGRASVIADADLLNVRDLGPSSKHNLDGLLGELAFLEQP